MTSRTQTLLPPLLTLALMALIATLSLTPDTPRPGDDAFAWLVHVTPTALQKSMHIVSYGTLAAVLAWSLRPIDSTIARLAVAFVIAAGFGALMEWLQLSIPGRFSSIYDIMLNAIGAAVGLAIGQQMIRVRETRL